MNFGAMTSYVSKRLIDPNNTAVDATDVEEGINQAIQYWKFRRFWFNEVQDTATLTAHSDLFPYPDDFLVPSMDDDGFYIEYGGMRYPLVKTTMSVLDAMYLSNGYGIPRWYARDDSAQQYKCYPLPDQNYTVGRHYLKNYGDLSGNMDSNDFSANASRLINLWALGNLITELRQDTEMGNYYRAAAQDEWRQLRVMGDKANGSGKLTIYSQLNDRGSI